MFNALKSSTRTQPTVVFSTGLNNSIGTKATRVRFMQQGVPGGSSQHQEKSSMDQKPNNSSKTMDSMSSFGEGYATRSDEEGFGGVYGGNQYLNKEDEEHTKDGKTTSNDASQGSEVKEKEKARNQK